MRVVLPAPVSPTRAWISPLRTVKLTWSLATTPGHTLVMLRISTAYGISRSSVGATIVLSCINYAPCIHFGARYTYMAPTTIFLLPVHMEYHQRQELQRVAPSQPAPPTWSSMAMCLVDLVRL